jgi:hypothetical protein
MMHTKVSHTEYTELDISSLLIEIGRETFVLVSVRKFV